MLLDEGWGDGPGQDHITGRHPRNLVRPQLATVRALGSASSGTPQCLRRPPRAQGPHISQNPRADKMSSCPHLKWPWCTHFTKSLVLSLPPLPALCWQSSLLPADQPVLCAMSSPSQSAFRGLHLPWERGTKSSEGGVQGEV